MTAAPTFTGTVTTDLIKASDATSTATIISSKTASIYVPPTAVNISIVGNTGVALGSGTGVNVGVFGVGFAKSDVSGDAGIGVWGYGNANNFNSSEIGVRAMCADTAGARALQCCSGPLTAPVEVAYIDGSGNIFGQNMTAATGTAAAPSISFNGYSGTGFSNAGGSVGVSFAGALGMGLNWNDAGNIQLPSTGNLTWSGGGVNSTSNTAISRASSNIVQIGMTGSTPDASGQLNLATILLTAAGGAPTSALTAGTAGEIIYYNGLLYFCSVTGAATHATWNKLNMTAV
jgi:hypothetical protein